MNSNFQLNWAQSLTFCKAFGMNLASFETEEEQNHFLQLINDRWGYPQDVYAHIGGSRNGMRAPRLNETTW